MIFFFFWPDFVAEQNVFLSVFLVYFCPVKTFFQSKCFYRTEIINNKFNVCTSNRPCVHINY